MILTIVSFETIANKTVGNRGKFNYPADSQKNLLCKGWSKVLRN